MNLDVMNGFIFVPNKISETGNPCWDNEIADAERRSELFATYNVTLPDLSPDELDRYRKYISVSDELDTLDKYDVMCIVRGEIYAPFIWLFLVLGIVFSICGHFQKTPTQEWAEIELVKYDIEYKERLRKMTPEERDTHYKALTAIIKREKETKQRVLDEIKKKSKKK